jgi:hypothetical protein
MGLDWDVKQIKKRFICFRSNHPAAGKSLARTFFILDSMTMIDSLDAAAVLRFLVLEAHGRLAHVLPRGRPVVSRLRRRWRGASRRRTEGCSPAPPRRRSRWRRASSSCTGSGSGAPTRRPARPPPPARCPATPTRSPPLHTHAPIRTSEM